jgi:WD40 repeat protein/serine/threonine protein kinase
MEKNEKLFRTEILFETVGKRMQRDCSRGCRIPIEHLLTQAPSHLRDAALIELIAFEVQLRQAVGEAPLAMEYHLRFPNDADKVTDALKLLIDNGIGRFQLIEQVGSGGFGTVYRAHDPVLKRQVALKIPRQGSLDCREVESLLREARAAARLKHPGIVQVYDAGMEGSWAYVACEFIEGPSLRKYLAKHPVSFHQAATICRRVADALHHAHELGIIHQDVKPSNILLDAEKTPYITDFGLARNEAEESPDSNLRIAGTWPYMSPEQVRGDGRPLTAASEIYSLGVVLFEMLTGSCPFLGKPTEVVRQIQNSPLPRPRQRNSQVPRDLEAICLKCLAREPGKRYASAAELADDLRRYLTNEPVRARPGTFVGRGWRWSRRKPALAAALALLAVVVTAATSAVCISNWKALDSLQAAETNLYFYQIADSHQKWLANSPLEARESLIACPNWMRDFEWWYLHGLFRTPRLRLRGAGQAFAFRSDGARIVTAGGDQPGLKVWDAKSGNGLLYMFPPDVSPDWVRSVDYAPNGQMLVSGSAIDGALRLWDADGGQFLRVLGRHTRDVVETHFVGDGSRMISLGRNECLILWDTATGQELQTLCFRPKRIRAIAVSPIDSRVVVSTGYAAAGNVSVWDYETGEKIEDISADITQATGLTFSRDGRLLAVAHPQSVLQIWEMTPLRRVQTIAGPVADYACPAFDPDGQRIAAEAGDGSIGIWDVATSRQLGVFRGHVAPAGQIRFSPDGRYLVAGSRDSVIRCWDTQTEQGSVALSRAGSAALALAISPRGDSLATVSREGAVELWNLDDLQRRWTVSAGRPPVPVWSVAFSPDGRRLACACEDASVRIYDVQDGSLQLCFSSHRRPLRAVAFSPDGTQVASAGLESEVLIWDADSGQVLKRVPLNTRAVRCLAFHPDGTRLAAGTRDAQAVVWDLASGQELWSSRDGLVRVWSLAWSPDGSRLAVARGDGFIRLHDGADGVLRSAFGMPAHEVPIDLAFSPNGQRLATAFERRGVTLWEVPTGREVLRISRSASVSAAVAFSPHGQLLATADRDGAVKLWYGQQVVEPDERGRLVANNPPGQTSPQLVQQSRGP